MLADPKTLSHFRLLIDSLKEFFTIAQLELRRMMSVDLSPRETAQKSVSSASFRK